MASYRVFQFSNPLPNTAARGDDIRVLRDGFSVFALAVSALYLLWYRLWAGFLVFLGLGVVILLLADQLNPAIALFLNSLFGIYLGFEGSNWQAAKLRHNGWQEIDVVLATNYEEAEARALRLHYGKVRAAPSQSAEVPMAEPASPTYPPIVQRRSPRNRVIGTYAPKPRGSNYSS